MFVLISEAMLRPYIPQHTNLEKKNVMEEEMFSSVWPRKNVPSHCSKNIKEKQGKSYQYHFDNRNIQENRNGGAMRNQASIRKSYQSLSSHLINL